jgi:hypothetical protein
MTASMVHVPNLTPGSANPTYGGQGNVGGAPQPAPRKLKQPPRTPEHVSPTLSARERREVGAGSVPLRGGGGGGELGSIPGDGIGGGRRARGVAQRTAIASSADSCWDAESTNIQASPRRRRRGCCPPPSLSLSFFSAAFEAASEAFEGELGGPP